MQFLICLQNKFNAISLIHEICIGLASSPIPTKMLMIEIKIFLIKCFINFVENDT